MTKLTSMMTETLTNKFRGRGTMTIETIFDDGGILQPLKTEPGKERREASKEKELVEYGT